MMRQCRMACLLLAGAVEVWAQSGPVIFPRGVTNAFTQEPAPAHVGLGGLVQIAGSNLGPAEGATVAGVPWPTELGGVQVFVNGKAAPLYSVSPGSIVAQVPFEAGAGTADVVVEREGVKSAARRVIVDARRPAVKTASGKGYGQAAGSVSAGTLTLAVSGLGETDPSLASGSAGEAKPKAAITAFIGGVRAEASATASSSRPGEFDLQLTVPDGARAGDLVTVMAERQSANQTVYRPLEAPQMRFVRMPEGAPELRFLSDTDLNGTYIVGTGARGDDGCNAAVIFDMRNGKASALDGCLASGNKNLSPLVAPDGSDAVGALAGPAQGDAPAGVSAQVRILSPSREPLTVDLPGAASSLQNAGSDFRAVIPGTPTRVVTVDSETGALAEAAAGQGGSGAIAPANLKVDIDGLTHVLATPVTLGQNRVAVIAADDADQPKRAKFAVISIPSGDVGMTKDFPDGWVPLLAPLPPRQSSAAGALAQAYRATVFLDDARRTLYVVSRAADGSKDGFAAFPLDRTAPSIAPLPDGWFAASCTYNAQSAALPVFRIELARRVALVGARVAESAYRTDCSGTGFIYLDQGGSAGATAIDSQMLASGAQDFNDYVYAHNYDPSRRGQTADTIFVFDGTSGSVMRMSLPLGVNAFTPQTLARVPGTSWLLGSATDQAAGDQGLILFDLDMGTTRILPPPADFDAVNEVAAFPATRKLVARATRQNASRLVIYTLPDDPGLQPEITVVDNPNGVAWIGPLQQRAGGGAGGTGTGQPGTGQQPGTGPFPGAAAAQNARELLAGNPKANTVAAVAYGQGGRQLGIVLLRVP